MWHTKNIKEIEKELRTNIKTGLGDKDVQIRQDEFGKNKKAYSFKQRLVETVKSSKSSKSSLCPHG